MEVSRDGNPMPYAFGVGVLELQIQVQSSLPCSQLMQLKAMV